VRALAELRHPNTVRILDDGVTADGQGEDLRELVLHNGIVHRDIKPENVLGAPRGRARRREAGRFRHRASQWPSRSCTTLELRRIAGSRGDRTCGALLHGEKPAGSLRVDREVLEALALEDVS
jgi:hypothetical protein